MISKTHRSGACVGNARRMGPLPKMYVAGTLPIRRLKFWMVIGMYVCNNV